MKCETITDYQIEISRLKTLAVNIIKEFGRHGLYCPHGDDDQEFDLCNCAVRDFWREIEK